jgi:hypothetical protein
MATLASALLSAVPPAASCDADESDASFVLREADGSTKMIGSADDLKRLRSVMHGQRKIVLWTRIDGDEYVISDPTTLARARAIFTRDRGLDARQETLERDMEKLHDRQAAEGEDLEQEEQALDQRQEALDAEQDRASDAMSHDLEALVRAAIRDGEAHRP